MAKKSVEERIQSLEEKIQSLQERNQRLEDIHEIQNLFSRYEYMHTARMHEQTAELYAKKTPGVSAEIHTWGRYEGPEGMRRVMVGVHKWADHVGTIMLHTLTTPVIEVARDGETAKGVWISPGFETLRDEKTGELRAFWCWGKYGVDFVKEDGKWKIWHSHVYGILHPPYEKSWLESYDDGVTDLPSQLPDKLKADRPSAGDLTSYSPTGVPAYIPAPPEPYETFDEKTAY